MTDNRPVRVGVVDALAAGLNEAIRRPALFLIPALLDLAIWSLPRISIEALVQRFGLWWESAVRMVYSPAQMETMADVLTFMRESMAALGKGINLADISQVSWLAVPALAGPAQASRLTLISDSILAPAGVALAIGPLAAPPWRPLPLQVASPGLALLTLLALWFAGQVVVTLWVWWAAGSRRQGALAGAEIKADELPADPKGWKLADRWTGGRGLLKLGGRLLALNLLLALASLVLFVPLAGVTTLLALTGGGTAMSLLFVLAGGLTLWVLLWFLSSAFFTSEAVMLDGQSLGRSLWQSFFLVRASGLRTFGLIFLVNLLMLAVRAARGLVGATTLGAFVLILVNAFLGTGLLLGVFYFYAGLRAQVAQAAAAAQRRAIR